MTLSNSYEKVSQILHKNKENIMAIPGVHGIGVGKGSDYGGDPNPCLVVFMDTHVDPAPIPKEIDNIPVYIVQTEPFKALAD